MALTLSAAGVGASRSFASAASGPEDDVVAKLEAQAKDAGIAPFRVARTEHFLGVGNAPDGFRKEALGVCEALGKTFVKHLRERGFSVDYPAERMTVVVLKDSSSYGALLGEAPGKDVGGHYDLDADRLVVFDFRPDQPSGSGAERINTFTLVHETAHLLSYHVGLMSPDRDPGKCVAEGVATYFEMWRKTANVAAGRINRPRLEALRAGAESGAEWIDTARLLADDGLFDDPETAQVAYGQAWLLMYHLLTVSRSLWPDVVRWFAAMKAEAGDRAALAEKHLGSLAKLDQQLQRLSRDLRRG